MFCLGLVLASGGCTRPLWYSPERDYQDCWLKLKRGDLKAASEEMDGALRRFPSPDTDWHWRFTVLRAEILMRQRLNDESLALLKPDLPPSLADSDIAVWRKLTQGAASGFLLQFDRAEAFLDEAEALAKRQHPELLGEAALRKGTLAFLRGDMSQAQLDYHQTLEYAREQKDPYLEAAALGSLGLIDIRLERYDESIDWNREALKLSQSLGTQSSIAKILGNMGWSYIELGDFDTALTLRTQAEELSARAGQSGDRIYWLNGIGDIYLAKQQYDKAASIYQSALALAEKLDDQTGTAQSYMNLAMAELQRGHLDSAYQYNHHAAGLLQEGQDRSLSNFCSLIEGRIQDRGKDYAHARDTFERLLRDPDARTSIRWEAESRLAQVYASQGLRKEAERHFRRSMETIQKARSSVSREDFRLTFLSSAIAFYDDYIDFLISQRRTGDALQVAELSRARTLAEGLESAPKKLAFPVQNFHPQEIARHLDATILFYWLGEKHSYLWAVTARAVSLFTLPPAAEIDSLVSSYRQALVGPRDAVESEDAAGKKLYEILLAPAKNLISSGSHIVILPDGSLYGLNFETLIVPAPKPHYWIEDALVTNANSLLLLEASLNRPMARTRNLLLVGDPESPNPDFPKLPQAGAEMELVEKYFDAPSRKLLSGSAATPGAYLTSQPGQYSFVHFVAHGTASRTIPLDSAVILTKQGDSYKLYARDILKQPLHADLVTISACHGAGDRAFAGEGLVGLTWAFLRAGAHGVVAALWEVNDASTPQLMDQLYAGISKGRAADASLREAKLKLLHSGTVYRKPFYWAPFEFYRGS